MAGVWFFEHWDMIVISILFMFICIEAHETRNNERILLYSCLLRSTKYLVLPEIGITRWVEL